MDDELIYQVALTMLPGIGNVNARELIKHFGSPEAVLKARKKDLKAINGIGTRRIDSILNFDLDLARKEVDFIVENRIRLLYFQNADYPKRLLHCFDSPVLLYYMGNADLNVEKIVGIVGTRSPSDYGKSVCKELIKGLADQNVLIISGLAYGIDTIAHKAAVKNKIATVGVLGHGLDRIYPAENKPLAKMMIRDGGLLTEFRKGALPDRQNFPMRNRIVAGMCDCLVVIESRLKGGSLITAELANGYNRDVFAFPGKTTDERSSGCNYLIRTNRAGLITSADDLLYAMGWKKTGRPQREKQLELFIDLPEDQKTIYDLLKNGVSEIDELYLKSNMNGSSVAQALLLLEMQGIIKSLPGKIYEIN